LIINPKPKTSRPLLPRALEKGDQEEDDVVVEETIEQSSRAVLRDAGPPRVVLHFNLCQAKAPLVGQDRDKAM
jgi:hypothetical protein